MKSALEIAMEKTGCVETDGDVLTDAQKERLREERNITKGKIAEAEIMYQSERGKFEGAAFEGEIQIYLDQKRVELIQKKQELEQELQRKIEKIREQPDT